MRKFRPSYESIKLDITGTISHARARQPAFTKKKLVESHRLAQRKRGHRCFRTRCHRYINDTAVLENRRVCSNSIYGSSLSFNSNTHCRNQATTAAYLRQTGLGLQPPHAALHLHPLLQGARPGRGRIPFAALRPTEVALSAKARKRQQHVVEPSYRSKNKKSAS